jgi:hypothetical protein
MTERYSADGAVPASEFLLDWEVRPPTRTNCVTAVTIVTNLNRAALITAFPSQRAFVQSAALFSKSKQKP